MRLAVLVQATHGEDAVQRGIGDAAMLGQGNIALDLIVDLVAADDQDAAALLSSKAICGYFK